MCFRDSVTLHQSLSADRDRLFALAKVKLDFKLAEHEIIVKSIYKALMNTDKCRTIGSHWQAIGF